MTAEVPTKRSKRSSHVRGFYEKALTEAERADFRAALDIEGVDQEIALLRLRLREALKQGPKDLMLMLRGVDILARLVARRYRLPKGSAEQLASGFREALLSAGVSIPEGAGHE